MKILIDARPLLDPRGGGVTNVSTGLLSSLCSTLAPHQMILVTTGTRKPGLSFDIPHTHIPFPNKVWGFLSLLNLTSLDRAVTESKPDLLLLTNLGFVGKPSVPYFLLVHDLSFLIEPNWFTWKHRLWHRAVRARSLIERAAHVFAVSERTKRDLIQYLSVPESRITVIPFGLPTSSPFAELPPLVENRRFVLALNADHARKNISCAVEAVRLLKQNPKFSDLKLVLTGTDKNEIKKFQRPGHGIIFLGRPSNAALATLMRHAAALLYPSWYEGFGLPPHEAARFGTPCIVSTASALPETAPTGTLFAPPAKPHLWAKTIELILSEPDTYQTSTPLGDWTAAAEIIRKEIISFSAS